MNKTKIEYLDYTFNPIAMRCTPVSPGCANCWHLRTADRLCRNPQIPFNEAMALEGAGPFVLRERELSSPLRAKKPAVIGVQFMGDLFHEDVPGSFVQAAYTTMAKARQHTFLVLTKRAKRMADITTGMIEMGLTLREGYQGGDLPNIWHGVTVCNQQEADEKIPHLLKVPGRKWLSIEPMLGEIDLGHNGSDALPVFRYPDKDIPIYSQPSNRCVDSFKGGFWKKHDANMRPFVDAVILGGETGPGARPMHPDWVRSVRDQCVAAGVPFYLKQNGEWLPCFMVEDETKYKNQIIDGTIMCRVGSKFAGRLLDGREWNELPWGG